MMTWWNGLTGQDEEQDDPVQRALGLLGVPMTSVSGGAWDVMGSLGQGAQSVGQGLSDVGTGIGQAVSDAGSRLTAPPTAGFPEPIEAGVNLGPAVADVGSGLTAPPTAGFPGVVDTPEHAYEQISPLIQPAGGLPETGRRIRELNDIAAAQQGRPGDVRAMFTAGEDPAWRAANPERAAEYDALQNQYTLGVGGMIEPVRFGRGPNIEARIAGAEAAAESARARLDAADAAVARAENGSPQDFNAARRDYTAARQAHDAASDAMQHLYEQRRQIGGRIEEAGFGRPVEDAGIQTTAQPRDAVPGEVVSPYRLEGTPSVSLNAGVGTVPEGGARPPDRLSGVNRVLGQGLASSVSGGVGAQVNQELNPDDPYAAWKGFAAGALVPAGSVAAARRLSRLAGAEARGAEGALATLGQLPGAGLPGVQRALTGAQRRAATMAAKGLTTPSPWEWMKQLGYSGIYGPATAVNAAVGGAQELLLSQPKEALRALVEGRPVATAASLRRGVQSIPEGLAGLGKVLLGDTAASTAAVSGGSQGTAGLSERVVNPVGHLAARLLEKPGEVLTEAPDALFRPSFIRQGQEREAARVVREMGLRGPAREAEAARLLQQADAARANPTAQAVPAEVQRVVDAGTAHADALGYKGDPGKLGQWLASTAKRDDALGVLASFLMPFPGMAARMTTAAARSTPGVGLLPFVRRGQSRFDTVYDQAFGSLVAAGLAGWAFEGGITGSGPDDPEKRAELQAMGWQPNATLVGGHYLPNRAFGRYQPMFDAAGELHDMLAYRKPGDKKGLVLDLARRATTLATDQTGLSGLADVYDMFANDKGATFPGWAARSAVRYLPGGGILRAAAAAADPVNRRPERWQQDEYLPLVGIGQGIEQAIPGLRGNVPAAQDVLGRPAPNPQQGLGAVIPRTTTARDEPLIQAYYDAGVDIGAPKKEISIGGTPLELTPAEQRRWQTLRGETLATMAGPLVSGPGFATMDPVVKQTLLRTFLQTAGQTADAGVFAEIPAADQGQRLNTAIQKKLKPAG